ncbi:MAG: putative salt-induced outer membrane protein [Rickettsiales bacterium]|jgi:putative salt-induced outer membrane protein
MLKKILISSCLLAIIAQSSNAAQTNSDYLPASIKNSLFLACQTKDVFIINAVRDASISQNPNFKRSIQDYVVSGCEKDAKKKEAEAKKKDKVEKKNPLEASIEAGFSLATGNNEQENFNIDLNTTYEADNWKTIFKASAVNRKENELRTAEEYRTNINSRYKADSKGYFFGEGEYVSDRFSGYNFRISETFGYGRTFVKNDLMKLEGEASAGGRHSNLTNGERENSLIQKNTLRFSYKIAENIIFLEQASISFGREATISMSETSIKTKLSKSLYLNFGITFENISEVPVGTKKTDTLTKLNLGYEF